MLYVAAHPDDEDSALIARLTRGDHARAAYLSLNRGEGGQNIVGPELFEALGIIRTEELLQARALDGGNQFFTRTFDYGFSKTLDEARSKWDEEIVLGDVVRAIRLFRPLIVASRFSGTPADGHGQHQFAGYITPRAFDAAGDPLQFQEQLAEGLRPWQPKKLYQGQTFRDAGIEFPLEVDVGRYDPILGRSYFEIAMQGRSQHKSQQMGVLELRGPHASRLRLLETRVAGGGSDESLFDGIDTTVPGIAAVVGLPPGSLGDELAAIERAARRAMRDFDALTPSVITPALAEGLTAVREARDALHGLDVDADARFEADFLLAHKARQFEDALQHAAGVIVDVLADRETVSGGEQVGVAIQIFTAEPTAVQLGTARIRAPEGWRVENAPDLRIGPRERFPFFQETADRADKFRIAVPVNAPLTQPYWLNTPRRGDIFAWNPDMPMSRPFAAAVLSGEVDIEVDGVPLTIARPVQYRFADRIRGELRRNLHIVPAVSVEITPAIDIVPLSTVDAARAISVRVVNHAAGGRAGSVGLTAPAGWRVEPPTASFDLSERGDAAVVQFQLTPPAGVSAGPYRVAAAAEIDDRTFASTMRTIAYPHIQTHRVYEPAETLVQLIALEVAPVSVGYIMGSGDTVPDAIRRMGLDVTFLDEAALATGDLSQHETIIVGILASQTRPDFVVNHDRLLDYARDGGALIVQYQQRDYVARGLPPFPAEMQSRVTDETAPVTILEPDHAAFNFPNQITAEDWDNWVQERNLYAFTTFDERYVPLLESNDPGEAPQRGGQVYAPLGDGHYVYTSYSWFRELPAGVPGAYRLFANLLSLLKAGVPVN